jgi:hypothetical protein
VERRSVFLSGRAEPPEAVQFHLRAGEVHVDQILRLQPEPARSSRARSSGLPALKRSGIAPGALSPLLGGELASSGWS